MNNKVVYIIILILMPFSSFSQFDTNSLKFYPSKIYDIFTNEDSICIINNGSQVNGLAKMIGKQTLVISENEYLNYNLSNYNIICIGNSSNNQFIKQLKTAYEFKGGKFEVGDTAIDVNNNFMAISYNPYNISNRLLQINKIDSFINDRFFDNSQFVIFDRDSVYFKGDYYRFFGIKENPDKKEFQSEKYANTDLFKFPKLTSENIVVDTSYIKKVDSIFISKNVDSIINKKVILLGENHYFTKLKDLEKQYVFELNRQSYYPYIILELPYSYTNIINNFLSIKDNEKAQRYFTEKLDLIAGTKEDSIFYSELRQWNILNPKKQLNVLCTDIEHNYLFTIKNILIPDLKKLGINIKGTVFKKWKFIENEIYLEEIENNNSNIPSQEKLIIDNLITTMIAYNTLYSNGFSAFNKIRLKSIIRKYNDNSYFGKIIKKNKFIVIGGSEHTQTKNKNNIAKNAEGYYLEYENKYTKGRTYSIRLVSFSYSVDSTMFNKTDLKYKPSNYYRDIDKYITEYKNGNININDSIFIFSSFDTFIKQLLEYGIFLKEPFSFNTNDIKLFYKPSYISFQDLKSSNMYMQDFNKYNEVIVVSYSPYVISR